MPSRLDYKIEHSRQQSEPQLEPKRETEKGDVDVVRLRDAERGDVDDVVDDMQRRGLHCTEMAKDAKSERDPSQEARRKWQRAAGNRQRA